ncbi:hypothetical protein ACFL96_13810, partial [Thermoproteota archaeon]
NSAGPNVKVEKSGLTAPLVKCTDGPAGPQPRPCYLPAPNGQYITLHLRRGDPTYTFSGLVAIGYAIASEGESCKPPYEGGVCVDPEMWECVDAGTATAAPGEPTTPVQPDEFGNVITGAAVAGCPHCEATDNACGMRGEFVDGQKGIVEACATEVAGTVYWKQDGNPITGKIKVIECRTGASECIQHQLEGKCFNIAGGRPTPNNDPVPCTEEEAAQQPTAAGCRAGESSGMQGTIVEGANVRSAIVACTSSDGENTYWRRSGTNVASGMIRVDRCLLGAATPCVKNNMQDTCFNVANGKVSWPSVQCPSGAPPAAQQQTTTSTTPSGPGFIPAGGCVGGEHCCGAGPQYKCCPPGKKLVPKHGTCTGTGVCIDIYKYQCLKGTGLEHPIAKPYTIGTGDKTGGQKEEPTGQCPNKPTNIKCCPTGNYKKDTSGAPVGGGISADSGTGTPTGSVNECKFGGYQIGNCKSISACPSKFRFWFDDDLKSGDQECADDQVCCKTEFSGECSVAFDALNVKKGRCSKECIRGETPNEDAANCGDFKCCLAPEGCSSTKMKVGDECTEGCDSACAIACASNFPPKKYDTDKNKCVIGDCATDDPLYSANNELPCQCGGKTLTQDGSWCCAFSNGVTALYDARGMADPCRKCDNLRSYDTAEERCEKYEDTGSNWRKNCEDNICKVTPSCCFDDGVVYDSCEVAKAGMGGTCI